ncbi:MAG: DUF4012 domain-containing protein [Candidatus Magasanikbacteria bacterium]
MQSAQPHEQNQNPPQPKKKKRKKWPYILIIILALLFGTAFLGFRFLKNITPGQLVESNFVQDTIVKFLGEEKRGLVEIMPQFLGFAEPRTYLVLFLNNTEMRPGGGFIGSYAVVRVNKGQTEILKVDGTENLDAGAPGTWKVVPPEPITEHLGIDRWYFRDSNWSPDFVESAKKALEFYKAEGGVAAGEIDTVIALTPTALERIMEITGSFTIEGIYLTPETVTEKLEYEVEYGYVNRGIEKKDRKVIIKTFFLELLAHARDTLFDNLENYVVVFDELIEERHLMVYSTDTALQKAADEQNMSGRQYTGAGDYLMWVDANMAALKTDHAMKRHLTYTITRRPASDEGEKDYYMAAANMEYTNTGSFDWRTTRYRTYARIFVPEDAELVSTIGAMKVGDLGEEPVVGQGIENGKKWFGAFISIEPGETKTLQFIYRLSPKVQREIEKGSYTLFVQKQLGTIGHILTTDLEFGKTITSAAPAEPKGVWGDSHYGFQTDLSVDREFTIDL